MWSPKIAPRRMRRRSRRPCIYYNHFYPNKAVLVYWASVAASPVSHRSNSYTARKFHKLDFLMWSEFTPVQLESWLSILSHHSNSTTPRQRHRHVDSFSTLQLTVSASTTIAWVFIVLLQLYVFVFCMSWWKSDQATSSTLCSAQQTALAAMHASSINRASSAQASGFAKFSGLCMMQRAASLPSMSRSSSSTPSTSSVPLPLSPVIPNLVGLL